MESRWSYNNIKEKHYHWLCKKSDYIEKSQIDQQDNVGEVTKFSHERLLPMPEKSAFMFHHTFYPKPRLDLEASKISEEM